MRFVVTAIGSSGGRTVAQVVDAVVRYLDKPRPSVEADGIETPDSAGYYTDGSNDPGRWLGSGARSLGLRGQVRREDLARLLSGRDPATGERLVGAAGSAGRRATLGVGSHTRGGVDGDRLFDECDAAAALGVEAEEFDGLVRAGTGRAFAVLLEAVTGHAVPLPLGPYVAARVEGDVVVVSESALAECEAAMAAGAPPAEVEAAGDSSDLYSLAEAARIAGVTRRYLRRLAGVHERHAEAIAAALAAGRPPGRAYLVAERGTRNQWLVQRSELVAFLRRRTTPAVRVGYDVTLTTEKSLGVLGLLGDADTRAQVLDAIRQGNDAGLAWLEERGARARVGGEVVDTAGWSAASFLHLTSRALDPFPHFHNVVAAAVQTPDGNRRVLDARPLYGNVAAASAVATLEMRRVLTEALDVTWRRSSSGGWEVAGIPDAILREFSQRRNEIDAAVAQLESEIGRTKSIAELQHVVTSTRPPKQQANAADLLHDWRTRAMALGFDPEALAACRGATPSPRAPLDGNQLRDFVLGPSGVCANTSVFTHGELLRCLVDAPVGHDGAEQPMLLTVADLEALAEELLASPEVIALDTASPPAGGQQRFTTRRALAVQDGIVAAYRAGLGAGLAVVPDAVVDRHLDDGGLGADQAQLVRAITTSGHHVHCAIGRAGSGKTTALAAAADAWRSAGYRVVGAAVKGEAARVLGHTARIPSETVAWYLVPRTAGDPPLDARTVLIVDEASTLADADLAALIALTAETGAALRLIGDPVQHSAVTPGGMFRVLCERHRALTPELHTSRRLQHPADRAAADQLRSGQVADALATLHDAGHLHYAADDAALYAKLLDSWWRDLQAGRYHPLVERSNHRRRQLNRLARRLLQADGQLGPDTVAASGGRHFAVGDRVIARKPARHLHPADQPRRYVRNGMTGTVLAVNVGDTRDNDHLVVAFEGTDSVEVPRSFFDEHHDRSGRLDTGLDHAYALTSYAVQGATFEASTSHIDENSSRAEAYVDVTRGRQHNQLYATRREDPLDGEHLPKAPSPPLEATVAAQLARDGEITAWELAVGGRAHQRPRRGHERTL